MFMGYYKSISAVSGGGRAGEAKALHFQKTPY